MDNNNERLEALKPLVFDDASVFYGMYDSDVTKIPEKKEDIEKQIAALLKIKDLNARQIKTSLGRDFNKNSLHSLVNAFISETP